MSPMLSSADYILIGVMFELAIKIGIIVVLATLFINWILKNNEEEMEKDEQNKDTQVRALQYRFRGEQIRQR